MQYLSMSYTFNYLSKDDQIYTQIIQKLGSNGAKKAPGEGTGAKAVQYVNQLAF